jgi:hypothetical protein
VASDDDWRLRGQEDWLADRPPRWPRWWPVSDGWDHDHCAFCWAEISTLQGAHADAEEAYVTADDDYTWVCASCFADFLGRFRWTVTET